MDPYNILGVKKDATPDEIKSAYRKLAKDHHPDANGGNDTKFKEISSAYKILTDPKEKARFEEEKLRSTRSSPFGRTQNPEDFFRDFMKSQGFSGGMYDDHFHTKVKMKTHGEDILVRAYLSLEDALSGRTLEVSLERKERINMESLTDKNKRVRVTIPRGAKNGQQLVLKGQGNQGMNGGRDGDIIILVEIKSHKFFSRQDNDLHTRIKIPFTQAILGDTIRFKNIDGEEFDITIPPCSQQGNKIEVLSKGMPVGNSPVRGNLIIHLGIELPTQLDDVTNNIFRVMQEGFGNRKAKVEPSPLESI